MCIYIVNTGFFKAKNNFKGIFISLTLYFYYEYMLMGHYMCRIFICVSYVDLQASRPRLS